MGRRSGVATVEAVVMPRPPGVEERPDRWRVSADVYGVIAQWAMPRGLQLLGWVHTHGQGVPAWLSHADRTRSIQAPGVLAVVIGSGGDDEDPARWGWYVYEDGDYRDLEDRERINRVELCPDGAIQRWRASLAGVVEESG
jgi:proteasome lid subunit RPN8/RPN11